jgi:hypothetical protein
MPLVREGVAAGVAEHGGCALSSRPGAAGVCSKDLTTKSQHAVIVRVTVEASKMAGGSGADTSGLN